ncbi:MAG TPA: Ig-like domain-containing protein, partial [bacterium]|nr:Ig-like domain-containing protein [bacterium]
SAIYEAASLLQPRDRLHLASAAGAETLQAGNPSSWEKPIEKVLAPANAALDMTVAMKKLAGAKGLKQAIWIGDASKLPPAATRGAWQAEAKKHGTAMSFVVLGTLSEPAPEIYSSLAPAGLGFEILSAAAETWGDATLKFPTLAPLPRARWIKNQAGLALVNGKVEFEIQVEDPSVIQSLTFQLDEDKPQTLDKATLRQSLDLAALKVKPGAHRLNLSLTTSDGDVVSEKLELQYVARRPLRFVKPLDKDSISGNFNVMLAAGQTQGLEIQSLELSVDGQKIGQATSEPYLIPLNTTTLSEGAHALQAVQTYSDGSSETQQVQVNVSQQTPALQILRPSNGEYLSNLGDIEAQVGGGLFEQVQKVEFLVDGEWIGESLAAPYRFLWANSAFPAGNYFIQARAYLGNQATVTDAVAVQLGQGEVLVQADPSLSPSGM